MNITIFGASGKVGRLVVAELLSRGHTVTVFVRKSGSFNSSTSLRVIEGDIYQPQTVARAVVGADAVICTLGSWGSAKKDILMVGMQHIIPAMNHSRVQRIVTLTGADARADGDRVGILNRVMHVLLRIVAAKILSDGENHINQLQQSNLNWTVVRSPIMNNRGIPENFQLTHTRPLPWAFVNRTAVARSLVDCALTRAYAQEAVYIRTS